MFAGVDTTLLRRLALLLTLMVWQGGFMFYGGVVVPVGAEVLGSHTEQGFVTRSVTNYLNLAGGIALVVWAWELAAGRAVNGRSGRWALWGFLTATLGLLVWLHVRLDALLDPEAMRVLDRPSYRSLHRWYLTVSTIQWAGCLVLAACTLRAWRDEDGTGRFHGDRS